MSKTTVEVYNGLISDMRKDGATLQEIADTCGGISRERIRQILNAYYPRTKTNLIPEATVVKLLGISAKGLGQLRLSGKIIPHRRFLYRLEQLPEIAELLLKYCKDCGKEIEYKRTYCPECSSIRRKNIYPFLPIEGKRKHIKVARRWQKNNPERNKELVTKAQMNYRQRNRLEYYDKQRYIVIRSEKYPVGTILKAVSKQDAYLFLENGDKISLYCVRKLYPNLNMRSGKFRVDKGVDSPL